MNTNRYIHITRQEVEEAFSRLLGEHQRLEVWVAIRDVGTDTFVVDPMSVAVCNNKRVCGSEFVRFLNRWNRMVSVSKSRILGCVVESECYLVRPAVKQLIDKVTEKTGRRCRGIREKLADRQRR